MKHLIYSFITASLFFAATSSAQNNTFPTTGNVGIGTTTPAAKLDIIPANGNALLIRPFGTAANSTGMLQFRELAANGTNYVAFRAPDALGSNLTFRLPTAYGSNGQVLGTTGSGVLTWITPAAGGGGASTSLNNLTATSINQALLPSSTNMRDLGSAARGWRNIYMTGSLYMDGNIQMHNSGTSNLGVGKDALQNVSSASYNTAIGDSAMYVNQQGSFNAALGFQALAFGNPSGSVAVGYQALRSSQAISNNTAIGYHALYGAFNGFSNTAVGKDCMKMSQGGQENTAVGNAALYENDLGAGNVALGSRAMELNSGGSFNTVVGGSAWSLINNSGNSNAGLGYASLLYNNGSNNTMVGAYAYAANGTAQSNMTALGFNAGRLGNNSNTIEIGNSSVGWIGGQSGWFLYSDRRIKDNIKNDVAGLAFITKLNPVTYNLNITKQHQICGIEDKDEWEGKYDIEKIKQTGFIAQEVEAAAKACNYDFNGVQAPYGNSKLYSIQYASFVVPLVKAVQELNAQNVALQQELSQIKSVLSEEQLQKLNNKRVNEIILKQNTPNPFNKSTKIQYDIPFEFRTALLNIYSSNGTEIKSFPIDKGGSGAIIIEANSLSSGIYSYTLIVDDVASDVKQMIVTQ